MVPAKQHLDQPHRATGTRAVGLSIVHPPESARMPDLDGTPGEIIVHAVEGNLPNTLDGCDQLMQSVNAIGWMAQARICQHVRDTRLYTERFETFEACCNELWSLSRSRVHRMIEGAEVASVLPIGNKPANEAQARPLTKLPADEQADAWEEVVADAEATGEKITAKKVEQVVAKRRGEQVVVDTETGEVVEPGGPSPKAHKPTRSHTTNIAAKTALELPHDPHAAAKTLVEFFDRPYLITLVESINEAIGKD